EVRRAAGGVGGGGWGGWGGGAGGGGGRGGGGARPGFSRPRRSCGHLGVRLVRAAPLHFKDAILDLIEETLRLGDIARLDRGIEPTAQLVQCLVLGTEEQAGADHHRREHRPLLSHCAPVPVARESAILLSEVPSAPRSDEAFSPTLCLQSSNLPRSGRSAASRCVSRARCVLRRSMADLAYRPGVRISKDRARLSEPVNRPF